MLLDISKTDDKKQERDDKMAANKAERERQNRDQKKNHEAQKEERLQNALAEALEDYHFKWDRALKSGKKVTGHPPRIENGKVVLGLVSSE